MTRSGFSTSVLNTKSARLVGRVPELQAESFGGIGAARLLKYLAKIAVLLCFVNHSISKTLDALVLGQGVPKDLIKRCPYRPED